MRPHGTLRTALIALLVGWMLMLAVPAFAHTELDSTTPQDEAEVIEGVSEVVLTFRLPVAVLGEGITVIGPRGQEDVEVAGSQEDAVFTALAAEPLSAGDYLVEWTVAAEDGHPLSGEFGFSVAQTSDTASETRPGAATEVSPSEDDAARSGTTPDDAQVAAGDDDAVQDDDAPAETGAGDGVGAELGLTTVAARAGAGLALTGLMLAAGGQAFLVMVLRGGQDVPAVLRIVRWAGVAVLVGATLRLLARSTVIT